MENDAVGIASNDFNPPSLIVSQGVLVDLYVPRKCAATSLF